jgi:hypothetical protein
MKQTSCVLGAHTSLQHSHLGNAAQAPRESYHCSIAPCQCSTSPPPPPCALSINQRPPMPICSTGLATATQALPCQRALCQGSTGRTNAAKVLPMQHRSYQCSTGPTNAAWPYQCSMARLVHTPFSQSLKSPLPAHQPLSRLPLPPAL